MMDYDGCEQYIVEDDVARLQEGYGIGPCYVFKSSEKGFHVICLSKFQVSEILELMRITHCDANYRTMPLRNTHRSWVLRTSPKGEKPSPAWVKTIGFDVARTISSPHHKLLTTIYNVPQLHYEKEDEETALWSHEYETTN